ncbi:MAG: hypothetical protein IT423_05125, partial [Pirellulaceae bacterium]|nr:hypothetical protein [Pirellulaceae bacterium]
MLSFLPLAKIQDSDGGLGRIIVASLASAKRAIRGAAKLPKFRPTSDNIDQLPAEQKWLYLFTHATQMEPDELSD